MNSLERVQTALRFERPDRLPANESPWEQTAAAWYEQGIPPGTSLADYFDFDIALFFLSEMPTDRAASLLEERIRATESALEHLGRHMEENLADQRVPRIAQAIFEHTVVHLRAEVEWLSGLRKTISSGIRE